MFLEVNGIKLYYEKRGEGRPLILLHGNGEDHTIFDQAVLQLEKRYCCYVVDSRCHGQSGEGELHYRDMARDMLTFMIRLELEDVIFCGYSDGAIVGLFAAAWSQRITTLIVCGANLSPWGVKLWAHGLLWVTNLFKPDPKLALMLDEPWISDDILAKIRANTLVLAGSCDLIQEGETRHVAGAIPGAELMILPGENHGSYIVHSEKIAKLITDHCRIH